MSPFPIFDEGEAEKIALALGAETAFNLALSLTPNVLNNVSFCRRSILADRSR